MHYAKAATRTRTNAYSTLHLSGVMEIKFVDLSSHLRGVIEINFVDLSFHLHGATEINFVDLSVAINAMRSSEIHLNKLSTKEPQPRQKKLASIRITC